MSLHIEPTEDAVETLRKERRKNYIAALATSILSVVLAGAILYSLTIIIAPPEEPKVVGYITPDDAPPSDTPPPPEVQRETSSSSHAETPVKVVVAAAAAPVSLPKIDIDPPDEPVMLEEGTALGMGDGFGPDLGDSTSAFGTSQPSGSTLVGTFYDTKQTPGGRPTNLSQDQFCSILSRFVTHGWDEKDLNRFYKSPQQLYAAQFYVPRTSANEAPKAYGCADKVKPSRWIAIYRGKVRAPKSGTFRFVGAGDDVIAVRFNNENVFDYGWFQASLGKQTASTKWIAAMENKPGYDDLKKELKTAGINVPPVTFYKYSSSGHWNRTMGGVVAGKSFKVKQGNVYPIEILISEIPGGEFGMTLLLEEVGMAPMSKDPKTGAPILPLFRTNYGVRNRTRTRNTCHLTKSALSGNPSNNRQFSVFLSLHAHRKPCGHFACPSIKDILRFRYNHAAFSIPFHLPAAHLGRPEHENHAGTGAARPGNSLWRSVGNQRPS